MPEQERDENALNEALGRQQASQEHALAQKQSLIEQSQRSKEFLAQPGMNGVVKATEEGWQRVVDVVATGMEQATNAAKAEEAPPEEDEETPAEPEVEAVTEATVDVPATVRRLTLNIGDAPAEKAVFTRIWDAIQDRIGGKSEGVGFKVYGDYWFARWSNSFEDRDGEWFSEKAHDDFIARLNAGTVPMPALWVEHIPGTRIGQAKVVSRIGHFVVAAGTFDNTTLGNAAKRYYQKHAMKGVSHGFEYDTRQYSNGVFNQYNSFEFSPLRKKTPSNPWTTFKEVIAMKLTEKDLSILNDMFGEDVVKSEILEKTEQASKALEEANVRFKDFATPDAKSPDNAQVLAKAERDFKGLILGIVEDHAAVIQESADLKTAWVDHAEKSALHVKTQDEKIKAQQDEIALLRAEMQLRPRIASKADETAINTAEGKGKELLETVNKQMVERDGFWGTEVVKTP